MLIDNITFQFNCKVLLVRFFSTSKQVRPLANSFHMFGRHGWFCDSMIHLQFTFGFLQSYPVTRYLCFIRLLTIHISDPNKQDSKLTIRRVFSHNWTCALRSQTRSEQYVRFFSKNYCFELWNNNAENYFLKYLW